MIARNVTMRLKANSVAEFTQTRLESVSGIRKRMLKPIAAEVTKKF